MRYIPIRQTLLSIICLVLLAGCAGSLQNIPEEARPLAVYTEARSIFNDNLRIYLTARNSMSAEVQARWKKEIEPSIDKARDALDVWKVAVEEGIGEAINERNYQKVFTDVLALLMKFGVVEIK